MFTCWRWHTHTHTHTHTHSCSPISPEARLKLLAWHLELLITSYTLDLRPISQASSLWYTEWWPLERLSTSQSPEPVNVFLTWQRDFADVIKLRVLRWLSWLSGGPNVITRVPVSEGGKQEVQSYKENLVIEERSQNQKTWRHYAAGFKDGGRSH